jgi:hypothetical protein
MIGIVFKTAVFRLFLRVILICHTSMPAACIACFEILQSESSYLIVSNMHMHSTPRQLFVLKGELCISFKKIN